MTTTAILTEEVVKERESHRKACAYLKGRIVGYAVNQGMKWDGDPDRTEEFKQGFEGFTWDNVTTLHIIYNRIRHNRPHLKSWDADQEHLDNSWGASKILAKLAEFGYDVKGLV